VKVNSQPTFSIPRNFTFFSIPTIPPERLLNSFSFPLTDLIPGVPRGPLIHRAPAVRIVLCHMRGAVHSTKFSDQFLRVVILVSSQSHALLAWDCLHHQHRSISFHSAISLGQKRLYQKPGLLSFGFSPRSRSLCRLLPGPTATRIFSTLSLRIFLRMPELPVNNWARGFEEMSVDCSQICLCAPHRGVRIVCQDQARDSSEISAPPVFGTPVPDDHVSGFATP